MGSKEDQDYAIAIAIADEHEKEKTLLNNVSATRSGSPTLEASEQDILRVPFFELLSSRWRNEGTVSVDIDPHILHACIAFAISNFQSPSLLLTKLSSSSNVDDLVDALDFLGMKLPIISSTAELAETEKRLRKGHSRRTSANAHSHEIPNRVSAKDAASEICFSIAKNSMDLSNDQFMKKQITIDILFIVSHPKAFGPRLRTHAWNIFQKCITLTLEQKKQFARWVTEEGLKCDLYKDGNESDGSSTDCECTRRRSTGSIHEDYQEFVWVSYPQGCESSNSF